MKIAQNFLRMTNTTILYYIVLKGQCLSKLSELKSCTHGTGLSQIKGRKQREIERKKTANEPNSRHSYKHFIFFKIIIIKV